MKIVIPMVGIGEAGGIKVLFKLADILVDKGHDVTFIIIEGKDTYEKINIKTKARREHISIPPVHKLFRRSIFQLFLKMHLLYKAIPPCDVAIANFWATAYSVYFSRKPRYKLYYCQAYEPDFYKPYGLENFPSGRREYMRLMYKIMEALAAYSYRLNLKMFANNARIVNEIKNRWGMPEDIPVLPPGVDLSVFNPDRRVKRERLTVGIIVSPSFWKGAKYFFEAVQILRKRGKVEFDVLCAFGPPPRGSPAVEAKWVKPKTQDELADFYRSVDILVSPMLLTGEFPLPPLEGMACGCSVITTPIIYGTPGREYYEIPPGNAEAIADAVEKLLVDEELRSTLQTNGLKLAQQFSWEVIGEKFIGIINLVVSEGR